MDEGSVRWHRGGWELRAQHDGRRVYRRHRAPNTRAGRRSAEQALADLAAELGGDPESLTVARVLEQYRILRSAEWSPSTLAGYGHHTKAIIGAVGDVPVAALSGPALEVVYAGWVTDGSSPGTVRRRHAVLAAALADAERRGQIVGSPARRVRLPATRPKSTDDLPLMGEVLAALGGLGHDRLAMAVRLALATGARRGELVGLRWRPDVDLVAPSVSIHGSIAVADGGRLVRKSTKGGRPRVLSIDRGTADLLAGWGGEAPRGPVLGSPTEPGEPWHPGQVTLAWHRHRDAVGLGAVRFHDLRHIHATTLLAAGVPVATVAARLGHASTRMTFDVYGHAIPAHDQIAADVIGGILGGAG